MYDLAQRMKHHGQLFTLEVRRSMSNAGGDEVLTMSLAPTDWVSDR
jgi:hypothetical protein